MCGEEGVILGYSTISLVDVRSFTGVRHLIVDFRIDSQLSMRHFPSVVSTCSPWIIDLWLTCPYAAYSVRYETSASFGINGHGQIIL